MIVTLVVEQTVSGAACPPLPLDTCLPAGFGQVPVKLELQGDTRAVRVVYRCGVVDMDVKASNKIQGLCPVHAAPRCASCKSCACLFASCSSLVWRPPFPRDPLQGRSAKCSAVGASSRVVTGTWTMHDARRAIGAGYLKQDQTIVDHYLGR